MDEAAVDEVPRHLPEGTPVRAYEWIAPPLLLISYAVVTAIVTTGTDSRVPMPYRFVAVSLLVASAVALWVSGFLAYRNVDARSTERYLAVVAGALFVAGALLSISRSPAGVVPLVAAGRMVADRRYRAIRLLRALQPARRWRRTVVVAAVVGVLCLILGPLASELGLAPLIALDVAGRILAPVVFGLAWGFRPGAAALF